MPYTKKRNFTKRRKTQKNILAKKVAKIERSMVPNPKYIYSADATLTTSLTQSSPLVTLLNGFATGDTELTRTGDKAKMKYLHLNVKINRVLTTAETIRECRLLIVREKTTLGSDITPAQLFNSSTPPVYDTYNVSTRDSERFHVYYDKIFSLGPYVNSVATTAVYNNGGISPTRTFKISKKLNFVTDYSRGEAGTVADIDTNGLFLIVMTSQTNANDIVVKATWNIQTAN